jgi:PAS domain S-box-containing protein
MWNNLLHPDDQQRARDRWNHSLTTGEFYEIEYRFKAKDGSYRWFLGQAMPVKDEQGNITQWFGSCTDIEEQKQTESTLRWSEQRYELATLATNDAIWDWSLETDVLSWNNAIQRIFQYAPDGVEGTVQWWYDHIHPDDAARVVNGIHSVIDGGGNAWQAEYRFRRADGSYAQVFDRGHIAHDEAGRAVRMIGAMQDVTEYRKAEQALREREEEFTNLADNMAQLAWMARPDGNIYWYNQRWYDFTGTTLAQMQGSEWKKIHHPDHIGNVVEFLKTGWVEGQPWELTFPLRGKDGGYRWFLTRAVPLHDAQGKLVRWLGTNTDITEQKKLQEQLERAYSDLEAKVMFRTLDLEHQVQELQRQLAEASK